MYMLNVRGVVSINIELRCVYTDDTDTIDPVTYAPDTCP
jgi:hypothetical protein